MAGRTVVSKTKLLSRKEIIFLPNMHKGEENTYTFHTVCLKLPEKRWDDN